MAKRCVLVAFAVAGAALAAPSQRELSQEPRAGRGLHKAHAWLCSRHPQHRWCQHSGQQDKEALPSQQEEDILKEDIHGHVKRIPEYYEYYMHEGEGSFTP